MSDHSDPVLANDLLQRALRIVDAVGAAGDDDAIEPLESVRRRAAEELGLRRCYET